jgi:polysaccharide export outer membrane protein
MKFNFWNLLLFMLLATSCTSYKKVPYLQDTSNISEIGEYPTLQKENYIRFQPDDVLAITVNLMGHQEIATDYNLPLQPQATSHGTETAVDMGIGRQTYMVDKDGNIFFPSLGKIKVAGYTQGELEAKFRELLSNYIKKDEPIVTVRLINFNVYIIGETGTKRCSVDKDHLNIMEALTLAGGINLSGKREIRLVRNLPDGSQKIVPLDVSSVDIVSSPYYYLHQNDMIIIDPTRASAQQVDLQQLNVITSLTSFVVSLAAFVLFFYNFRKEK